MSDEIDHIANLERKLYARDPENIPKRKFGILRPLKQNVVSTWGDIKLPKNDYISNSTSGYKKFFLVTLFFFIIALGVAGFSIYRGASVLSSKNVEFNILSNSFVDGGEELPVQVEIVNKNSVDLINVKLILNYPKGSTDEKGADTSVIEREIGTIMSGKSKNESFNIILYGEKGLSREIKAVLSYQLFGTTAVLEKELKSSIMINSSPVDLSVDISSGVVSNQSFTFNVRNIFSGDKFLNNVITKIEYPNGFVFESSEPKPSYGNNVWSLGDMQKGTEKNINIKGRILGEENDEKAFRIYVGTPEGEIGSPIGTIYNSVLSVVKIIEPFISSKISINNQDSEIVTLPIGSSIDGYISFTNNSPLTISKPIFTLNLLGENIDQSSISINKGYFNSIDNTLIWNSNTDDSLISLAPGATGQFPFSFRVLPSSRPSKDISMFLSVKGFFPDRNNEQQTIDNISQKTIKFASIIDFSSEASFSTGPIKNTGPYPPRADQDTTYSINWVLKPVTNPITQIVVSATLPQSIAWAGVIIPNNEDVSFNPLTRVIEWKVASLPRISSVQRSRSLFFQIRTRPSKSQIDESIKLLGEVNVSAIDSTTNTSISTKKEAIFNDIKNDPIYTIGSERVLP